jgi:hypothetical protein
MAHEISFNAIKRATAAEAGIRVADLEGPCRSQAVVRPRQRACFVARRLRPELSLPYLGRSLGERDHTTVLHAEQRVEERLAEGDAAELSAIVAILGRLGVDELPKKRGIRPRTLVEADLALARQRVARLEAELAAYTDGEG